MNQFMKNDMKLIITEKQFKNIISNHTELDEEDANTVNPEPTAGTSTTQSGGTGYPEVGKWESGVTRGKANPIGNTKWESGITRGKANPLK
jgi:hypothetical protein